MGGGFDILETNLSHALSYAEVSLDRGVGHEAATSCACQMANIDADTRRPSRFASLEPRRIRACCSPAARQVRETALRAVAEAAKLDARNRQSFGCAQQARTRSEAMAHAGMRSYGTRRHAVLSCPLSRCAASTAAWLLHALQAHDTRIAGIGSFFYRLLVPRHTATNHLMMVAPSRDSNTRLSSGGTAM